ncbi:hypothetical protein MRB53_023794 [Persea americana]|uniref:Uncharacterized protein n=1 Tax=Persea americana TaxID=3435 RepID=A0ACC2LB88_PERAE|nr:hypothetical protein MRB53_023794 [Persea americana]
MEVKFGSGSVDYSLGLFLLRVMIVMRSPTLRMMDMFMGTKKLDVRNGANTRRGWRLRTCCYEVLMMELGDEEDDAENGRWWLGFQRAEFWVWFSWLEWAVGEGLMDSVLGLGDRLM